VNEAVKERLLTHLKYMLQAINIVLENQGSN
jgi:hypothetical protein